ncbi:hypothetical protein [Nocardia wallacei]|uniref:hypothetical protein n=1 Tax=Nocardia wallacei TaxID=480035 RepID=UPI0024547734|nr:hypothetical protein [Nocardia wallacei]
MPDPSAPWRGPHIPDPPQPSRALEEASRRALAHATRDRQGREVRPDPAAPRNSAAYRAAVIRDLMGRGLSEVDATTVVLASISFPGATGIQVQAKAVADQTRARAREREALTRELEARGRDR